LNSLPERKRLKRKRCCVSAYSWSWDNVSVIGIKVTELKRSRSIDLQQEVSSFSVASCRERVRFTGACCPGNRISGMGDGPSAPAPRPTKRHSGV
jgi:hypothetical protein